MIPRISMIPTDTLFDLKRLKFLVWFAFTITTNKSQGQSLIICDINLENSCFLHGQLYVICSLVGKPSASFIYALNNNKKKCTSLVGY